MTPTERATTREPTRGNPTLPPGASASGRPDSPSRDDVQRTYRRYAPVYDRVFGRVLEQGRRELAHQVQQLRPARLLEVGVGTGLMLAHYPADAAFTGIDISGEMLEMARQRAATMPERSIELLRMDAEQMQFDDHAFDCVTLPYVLSVTPEPDALVAEVRRVCKPDGHILVLNHFSGVRGLRWLERLTRAFADRLGFRSEFDFDANITRHSWQVESVHSTNLLGLSKVVVIRNRS